MEKFLPIILGADFKTFSLARIIKDEFNITPMIINSYMNDIFIDSDFNVHVEEKIFDDDVFINKLNSLYDETINDYIIFANNEVFLNLIYKNFEKIRFKVILPYQKLSDDFTNKDKIFEKLDHLDLLYPDTVKLHNNDKIEHLPKGALFIRPKNINKYQEITFDGKDNSYVVYNTDTAISTINKIFENGYDDELLVQEYIDGKDGNQFSVNGYRYQDGKFILSQARTILTDDLGNHIVQIDSNIEKINQDAKSIIEKLDYHGLFNIDFKINDRDGKIYITSVNLRLGYTFYYSVLNDVNILKAAIMDKIYNDNIEFNNKKFGLNIFTNEFTDRYITSGLFLEYKQEDRCKSNINPLYINANENRIELLNNIFKNQCNKRIKNRKINKSKFE